jgi:hypothetical protein
LHIARVISPAAGAFERPQPRGYIRCHWERRIFVVPRKRKWSAVRYAVEQNPPLRVSSGQRKTTVSTDAVACIPIRQVPIVAPRLSPDVFGAGLLIAATVVGLASASDYGLTIDEFNADDYGPKAFAWYASFGNDRSHFNSVEPYLWYYGPWNQILIATVQKLEITDPLTVRHALTFLTGIAGLAALIPLARYSIGLWAGPLAILLCLATGNLYGSLFFAPIDVPFLAAMTWATCAIAMMARDAVPSWSTTIAAGLLSGLAIATRTGGIITQAYLVGAMTLCALDAALRNKPNVGRLVVEIMARTAVAIVLGWITAITLWPWLQVGNPFHQFAVAYAHFMTIPLSFEFPSWGRMVWSNALPWSYVPEQFLARLPEVFIVLLAFAAVIGLLSVARFTAVSIRSISSHGSERLKIAGLVVAQSRGALLIAAAAIVPVAFLVVTHATNYDGIRHVLFVIPMLALIAGGALVRSIAWLRRHPKAAVAVFSLMVADLGWNFVRLYQLHPLEYVAINALAGGMKDETLERFELDYWGVATGEAVRKLGGLLDRDTSGGFISSPPRVFVCLPYREWEADRLFRRNWIRAVSRDEADFIIDSERWPCGDGTDLEVIDEVDRLGITFATLYGNNRGRELESGSQNEAGLKKSGIPPSDR